MFNKLTLALLLVAMCLSQADSAEAGSKSFGDGPVSLSGVPAGSGR